MIKKEVKPIALHDTQLNVEMACKYGNRGINYAEKDAWIVQTWLGMVVLV